MPIRAFVDDMEFSLPVPEQAWAAIKKASKIVLPCCGADGYARRSKLDVQHFVHKCPPLNCDWKPETEQHVVSKQEILLGCRDAGYEVKAEYCGTGWRADILAWKGNVRVAFEVQLSKQTVDETFTRQARYRAANVRCCWLFGQPPEKITQPEIEHEDDPFGPDHPAPCKDLPIFKLAFRGWEPVVILNDRDVELRQFVKLLLGRHVQFRRRVSFTSKRMVFDIREAVCFYCKGLYRFPSLHAEMYASDCGVVCRDQEFEPSSILEPAVVDSVLASVSTQELRDLHLDVRKAFFADSFCTLAFYCTCGNRAFSNPKNSKLCKPLRRISVVIPFLRPLLHDVRHWCYSKDRGELCPD